MNDNTPLHVLWGVFNNPFTPEKTKEEVKAMIAKLVAKDKTSKLSKKITSVLNWFTLPLILPKHELKLLVFFKYYYTGNEYKHEHEF